MKEKTCKTVRTVYGFVFGAFTIIVGALFIWKLLAIYLPSGDHPFTREIVAEALSSIALFIWLWVAGVIAGFILWEVFPIKEKPRKICPDLQYARVAKRIPAAAPEGIEKEYGLLVQKRKLVFALKAAAWALFGIAAVYGVVYLCLPTSFTRPVQSEEVANLEVLNLVIRVFPAIFAGLLVICGACAYEKFAVREMLPLANKVTKGVKREERAPQGVLQKTLAAFDDRRVIWGIRIAVAVLGVALFIWGALNGNMATVFNKAVAICSQCIGLG